MKYPCLLLVLVFLLCDYASTAQTLVTNNESLQVALTEAKPGSEIIMSNGIWNDVEIKITTSGSQDSPITLRAETPGEVLIQGASSLSLGGDHIHVIGLYFIHGHSPDRSVIHFAVGDIVANHCRITQCAIRSFNKAQRNLRDVWVLFKGQHNQLDHCFLSGKTNRGPTVRVNLQGNQNVNNFHKITHNHFGPRPPKGGPSAETIQIGASSTSMCPSHTIIANNLFDACNGEVEIISSKSNYNEFRNNVFYKSEGSLVTRHGNYCTIDGNYFIGDASSDYNGGVRLIGTGHTVTNNYFVNINGKEFRAPLAVMNGIPKSALNRYIQVTDVVVAYNSWINCTEPLQFGIGNNISQKDVLPSSEIRSKRPIRTTVTHNLIYDKEKNTVAVVAHDKLDGITFSNNVTNNEVVDSDQLEGFHLSSFQVSELAADIWTYTSESQFQEVYDGFGFENFEQDILGRLRKKMDAVGAFSSGPLPRLTSLMRLCMVQRGIQK